MNQPATYPRPFGGRPFVFQLFAGFGSALVQPPLVRNGNPTFSSYLVEKLKPQPTDGHDGRDFEEKELGEAEGQPENGAEYGYDDACGDEGHQADSQKGQKRAHRFLLLSPKVGP